MTEYIVELPDRGAADEFVAKMGVEDCRIYGYRLTGEVVRCRDCRNYHPDEGRLMRCRFEIDGFVQWRNAEANGFCSYAKRRES